MRIHFLNVFVAFTLLLQLVGCSVLSLLEPSTGAKANRPAQQPTMSKPSLPAPHTPAPAAPPEPQKPTPPHPVQDSPAPALKAPSPSPLPETSSARTAPAPSPVPQPVPVPATPAKQPLPGSDTTSSLQSLATDPQSYRKDAAKHLYRHYAQRIYQGKMPPLLKSVCVVDVLVGPRGQVLDIVWSRPPRHADVRREIESMILQAGPFPAPVKLRKVTYTETWLWDASGDFQLDTLTEGQM